MSRKLATIVKDSAIPGKYKRVLEAYAAFANNDGTNIRPSQRQLGVKASTSADTIQRNTPDLIACGILRQATSHTCKVDACNKGGTHFTGTWGRWTIVYNLDISLLQNAVNYLAAICGKVNAAKCRKVMTAKCGTTQAIQTTQAQTPDSCAVPAPSKEVNKERLLASLEAIACNSKQDKPTEFVSEAKTTPQDYVGMSYDEQTDEIGRLWTKATAKLFKYDVEGTCDEVRDARQLVDTYGLKEVLMILNCTLNDRPKSAAMPWTDFNVFARNFELNQRLAKAHYRKQKAKVRAAIQS
jgi:hypothetical protein